MSAPLTHMDLKSFGPVDTELSQVIYNLAYSITKGSSIAEAAILPDNKLYIMSQNGLLYDVDVSDIAGVYPIGFNLRNYNKERNIIINEPVIYNKLYMIVYNLNYSYPLDELIYHNQNMREDPVFDIMLNQKTSEGSINYIIPNTTLNHSVVIVLYRNMFNAIKSDSISLKIYKNNLIDNHLLSEFSIYKKKIKKVVTLRFIFIDLAGG